ncbi:MAG: hypothetical protein MJZ38_04245 [archaeon]|nr:hypothetical protein [archaeon]
MVELEKVILFGTPEGISHLQVDISPVLEDAEAFDDAREYMYQMFEREVYDVVIAVESAGTVFAASVAERMHRPLVIVGERDSMLRETVSGTIETYHGARTLRIPRDSIKQGTRAIIIGDVLSHGKDVLAAVNLVRGLGGSIVKIGIFLEHSDFKARRKLLKGIPLESRIITEDL